MGSHLLFGQYEAWLWPGLPSRHTTAETPCTLSDCICSLLSRQESSHLESFHLESYCPESCPTKLVKQAVVPSLACKTGNLLGLYYRLREPQHFQMDAPATCIGALSCRICLVDYGLHLLGSRMLFAKVGKTMLLTRG